MTTGREPRFILVLASSFSSCCYPLISNDCPLTPRNKQIRVIQFTRDHALSDPHQTSSFFVFFAREIPLLLRYRLPCSALFIVDIRTIRIASADRSQSGYTVIAIQRMEEEVDWLGARNSCVVRFCLFLSPLPAP